MIKRGDIYFVDLDPTRGREQSGRRPVLVLSSDRINRLPLVVTVVVGTKGDNIAQDFPTNVRIQPEQSGLPTETVFLGFQIRSIDPKRFPPQRSGYLSEDVMAKIESAVRTCLEL